MFHVDTDCVSRRAVGEWSGSLVPRDCLPEFQGHSPMRHADGDDTAFRGGHCLWTERVILDLDLSDAIGETRYHAFWVDLFRVLLDRP